MQKIPKIIHYCWFGGKPKPDLVLKCIDSWKNILPDYEIIEWNENNFDVNSHPYTKFIAKEKKWGFIVDYLRLFFLEKYGGIYLDSDMFLIKSLDDFLDNEVFTAYENNYFLSCGAIGSVKNNTFINFCLEYYDQYKDENFRTLRTGPNVLTENYHQYKKLVGKNNFIKIYPKIYFYPFDFYEIKKFNYKNAPKESFGVHLWNYSWGHPTHKFLKKIGLLKVAISINESLKLKKGINRIINMF